MCDNERPGNCILSGQCWRSVVTRQAALEIEEEIDRRLEVKPMKRTIKILAAAAILAVFAAPALAQTKECNDENKAAWYDTFLKNYKGEAPQQKIAYDAAKLYLTSCPEDPNDQIAAFMKNKFVVPYEKINAGNATKKQFEDAFKQKNYAEQIRLGKEIVASEPDSPAVYIIMGVAGLSAPAVLPDSAQAAKKAIEMIEVGKPFGPYESKDKALAALNYTIAKANLKTAPADAIPYLLKAARYESDLKKSPQLYLDLAAAYNDGPRAKQSEDYKQYLDKPESPESKLALANINQIIDRQIDALARATALASDAANKKAIMDELSEEYKNRNKTDNGLPELVANVLSKPLPDMPTPLTSLPTTPTSTPATGGSPGTNGTGQPGTTGGAKPAGANGAMNGGQNKTGSTTTTGTQTGGAKPAATPTPTTKRPRSNYRRG
jgi:hypothetical protein